MSNVLRWWKRISEEGMRWPFLHNPVTGKPSITLLFPYITFVLAFISVILLHIWPNMVIATGTSLIFWAMSTIFYMLRSLSKAKINLEEKSFELDGEKNG